VLKPPEGLKRLLQLLSVSPNLYSYLSLLPRAYEIASQARIGVFDCLYVALAEREQCELITADLRLLANLQKDFPFIVALDSIQP
jgi:predicted nucleic acid-binding protein